MSRLHILVVDDNADFAASLGRVFERRGHEVRLALGCDEAVELFRQHEFDVCFIDLAMPVKDGMACMREIRALKPNAPVVMMSGYTDDPLLAQATEEGALGALNKPFEPGDALDLLEKVKPAADGCVS